MTIASPTNPSSASTSPASAERYNGQVDSFEHSNCTIQVHWSDDPDMGPPWEVHEGHGVVLDGYDEHANVLRLTPYKPGTCNWYYDFDASRQIAIRDRWGLTPDELDKLQRPRKRPLTDVEITEAAVQADFEHLRAWCHDEWCWLAADVIVDVRTREGSCFLKAVSCLGGIESTGAADELEELLAPARAWIDENQERINQIARSHELICCTRRHLTEP